MKPSKVIRRGHSVGYFVREMDGTPVNPAHVKVAFYGKTTMNDEPAKLRFCALGAINACLPYYLQQDVKSRLVKEIRKQGPFEMSTVGSDGVVRGRLNNHIISISEWNDITPTDVIIKTLEKIEDEVGVR